MINKQNTAGAAGGSGSGLTTNGGGGGGPTPTGNFFQTLIHNHGLANQANASNNNDSNLVSASTIIAGA